MTFPAMDDAFWDWTKAVQLQVVTKAIVDFQAVETPLIAQTFDGVLEPVHPRKLMIKPEGQRNWKWWDLWTQKVLANGDVVQDDNGRQYRVMSGSDWSNGNYQSYELVQNPPLGS